MKDVKNYKYAKALWDCYQKGLDEIDKVSEKELFIRLIDDAVNQIVAAEGVSSKMQPVVSLSEQPPQAAVCERQENAGGARFWIAFEGTDNEQIYDAMFDLIMYIRCDRRVDGVRIDLEDQTWKPVGG